MFSKEEAIEMAEAAGKLAGFDSIDPVIREQALRLLQGEITEGEYKDFVLKFVKTKAVV
ncbi:MAG: hypothetical protein SPG61_05925 [Arcanobacterium sp.]|nr:hypothetical protein [Arcanobacterium sp.]